MKRLLIGLTTTLILGISFAQDKYNAKEYLSQVSISDLSFSPKGKYIVAHLDFEKDKTVYKLWRYSIQGNEVGQKLLLDNSLSSYSSFKWTSDDEALFFLGGTKDGTKLFKINMSGGSPQPTDLTLKGKLRGYDMMDENHLLIRETNTKKDTASNIYAKAKRVDYADPVSNVFYSYHIETGKKDSLFSISGQIGGMEISPDKSKILISHAPPFTGFYDYPNHVKESELAVYDVKTGKKLKQVTKNLALEEGIWADKDDLYVKLWSSLPDKLTFSHPKLSKVNLKNGSTKDYDNGFAGRINKITPIDNQRAIFTANVSTTNNFYLLEANAYKPISNFTGNVTNYSYCKSTGALVFSMATSTEFESIYFSPSVSEMDAASLIDNPNVDISKKPKPEVRKYEWKNSQGETIEGILIWPPGMEGKNNLPFAVDIHGGPWSLRHEQLSLTGLQYYYYGSLLASHGFLVLQPNYSGGVGRGDDFMDAIIGQPMTKPEGDILAAIESLKSKGWIDEDKMLVMGASYGGLLTNALIGSTNDFDLALSSCGVWDETYTNLSDGNTLDVILFGSKSHETRDTFWSESAKSRIDNIKTPTLITFGEKDVRVPVVNGYSMLRMLRDKGVETELVLLPGEGHIYRKPSNMLTKMKIELHWINKYLGIDIPME